MNDIDIVDRYKYSDKCIDRETMSFLLSKMCSLAAAGDFRGVVDLCEEKEVELAANEMERATAGEWPYAGQMLAHLIIDDLYVHG